jgi:hypothetical protein
VGFCGIFVGGDHNRLDHVSGLALRVVSLIDGVSWRC